jgi:2-haloalkanoic acid dehalogenase type II
MLEKPFAVTFDCYGTLVDWEAGITEFLEQVFRERHIKANIAEVLRVREGLDFELVQGAYRSYREILALSLRGAFTQSGIEYNENDGKRLAESVPEWPVFEETKPALERLAKHSRLAIISNIDADIIEKTRTKIEVDFDFVVTAQEARAYKPSAKPFELTLQKLGCRAGEVLHVSSGFRYDIPPASRLGFRTAWVNRKHEVKPSGAQAEYEFGTMTELAQFVERLAPS